VDFFVCLWQKQRKKQLLFLPSKRDEGKQNTKKNKGEGKTLEEITITKRFFKEKQRFF
jgi:hypothetical protein